MHYLIHFSSLVAKIHPRYIHVLSSARATASVRQAIDPWSSVFASLFAHMPSLCLSFTDGDEAFCLQGGGGRGGEVLCVV